MVFALLWTTEKSHNIHIKNFKSYKFAATIWGKHLQIWHTPSYSSKPDLIDLASLLIPRTGLIKVGVSSYSARSSHARWSCIKRFYWPSILQGSRILWWWRDVLALAWYVWCLRCHTRTYMYMCMHTHIMVLLARYGHLGGLGSDKILQNQYGNLLFTPSNSF